MANQKEHNSKILWTILISSLIVFLFLVILAAGLFFYLTNNYPAEQNIMPQITVVAYDTPTSMSAWNETPQSATPTSNALKQTFSKGLKVKIHGTGGDGLRIHQEPGENSPTIYLASEGEIFIVEDGPILKGGYIWWKIVSFQYEKTNGWAAEDFLQLVINSTGTA
jgi:hypothetical protein